MKFSKYLYDLQKKNCFHFSLREALQATGLPKEDLLSAINFVRYINEEKGVTYSTLGTSLAVA